MRIKLLDTKFAVSLAAAEQAAESLRALLQRQDSVRLVAATGSSQIEFLDFLTKMPGIDWARVELFHLDEYVGLPETHPASFARYIRERIIEKTGITNFHLLDGMKDPYTEALEVGDVLAEKPVDLLFAGIGENGHLAFNDPPADFETEEPYLVVHLDRVARQQQVGEGWFATFDDVPKKAISMSVRQILKASEILAIAPDTRKAAAVKATLEGEISPMAPASILRTHGNTTLYLDKNSASLLSQKVAGTS